HAARLIGVAQDVTERKTLEKKLQEQRAETETLFTQQVAAQTASAIAHELNQPLAAISAYSEVALHALQDNTNDPVKLKRALEGCVEQAQRAGRSLHELLAFLQKGELVTEKLDLNDIVKETLELARNYGYGGFHPMLQLDENMPAVLANRIQVQKVLVNLLRNAVEAMRGMRAPTSAITITVQTRPEINMAHITVQDSGPGLDPETAKRVFEPFFTTKPSGIGMGLAISRALTEANGGQLWLEPGTKPGATFHFTLPFAS
ncbi:MAG: sensor histidine kinase, partial [Methylotenera sp.]